MLQLAPLGTGLQGGRVGPRAGVRCQSRPQQPAATRRVPIESDKSAREPALPLTAHPPFAAVTAADMPAQARQHNAPRYPDHAQQRSKNF